MVGHKWLLLWPNLPDIPVPYKCCLSKVKDAFLHTLQCMSSTAKHYNRSMINAFNRLLPCCRIVDDIIYNKDEASHTEHERKLLFLGGFLLDKCA